MNEKIFSHVDRMAEKDSIYGIEVYCSVEWNQIEVRRDHEGVSKSLSTVEETDPDACHSGQGKMGGNYGLLTLSLGSVLLLLLSILTFENYL